MRDARRLISFVLVVAAFVASAFAYSHLPAVVPTHWGVSGKPNAFGSRIQGALVLPLVMLGVWLLMILLPRYDRLVFIRYDPSDSDESTVRPIYEVIAAIVLAILLAVHVFSLASGLGLAAGNRQPVLFATMGSLGAIIIGNYMPRVTRRNAFIGFRVPWAYASEDVWRRTQRAAGYGMVAAGVVGIIGAGLVHSAPRKPLFAAMAVQISVVAAYSYYLAHSRKGR
ncbi:MAG: DUF1648 domain-containing protein [Gemmatimonadota bacterium]|nr:DUF1648 domain-containing protein [Gemmatimonadota bacterium]